MITHQDWATFLRHRRKARGLSVRQAANLAGTHQVTVYRWEDTGRGDCVLMLRYLEALGVSVSMLRVADVQQSPLTD